MRISSNTFYTSTLVGIRSQQSAIGRLSQQLATNQRLLAPKDDPVATAQVLSLGESIAKHTQFLSNQQKADLALKQESTLLTGLHDALSEVRSLIGNSTSSLDQDLRDQTAAGLAGFYEHIKGLLNARDSNGDYVFAGFETNTVPFSHTQLYNPASLGGPGDSPDSAYAGDSGQRRVEIVNGRFVSINDDISAIADTGGVNDLLELIDQTAIDLHDSSISTAALQTSLTTAFSSLSTAMADLTTLMTQVTGRETEVSEAKKITDQFLLMDRNALGALTELDQAAAIIELQQRQVSLQAAESAFSLTSNLSLFNYLS